MKINRREFIKAGIAGATLLGLPRGAWADLPQAGTGPRPNFLFIMSDDQGWGDVGYYGHPKLKTPHLDAMAAAGLRCDRFYAATPVCSPTRGSCVTGRHPNRYGVFDWAMPIRPQERTLGHVAQQAGYLGGHFGKWHLNGKKGGAPIAIDDPLSPGKMGFQEWASTDGCSDSGIFGTPAGVVKSESRGCDAVTDATLAFIDKAMAQKKPFLAFTWYSNPHAGYGSYLPEDIEPYDGLNKREMAYYGEVTAVDRNVGRIRTRLRDLGIEGNTIVVFCSDNGPVGPGSTGGLSGGKHQISEGGLRVPGIIEWPDVITKPRRSVMPVCTSDFYPTVLDLLGVDVPGQPKPLDGVSLVPLLRGRSEVRESPLYFWNIGRDGTEGDAAVIDHHLRLAASGKENSGASLADLSADMKNVTKEQPEAVQRLMAGLDAWKSSVRNSLAGKDYA